MPFRRQVRAGLRGGRDYVMDWRPPAAHAGGGVRRARRRAGGGRVDLFVCFTTAAATAAKRATSTDPDRVLRGERSGSTAAWYASMARPGATSPACRPSTTRLHGKRLELLRELLPQAREVAVLWVPDMVTQSQRADADRSAGASLSIRIRRVELNRVEDIVGCHPATRAHRHRRVVHPPGAVACPVERRARWPQRRRRACRPSARSATTTLVAPC